jgi:predicted naringenin-chalcone synthase
MLAKISGDSPAVASAATVDRLNPDTKNAVSDDRMGVVLSDFQPIYLTAPVKQDKLREISIRFAEFVDASSGGSSGRGTAHAAAGTIRAAWEKYCVSPKHIDSRRISVLPDGEAAKDPADLDFATIPFTSTFLAKTGGADIDDRLAIFRRHARAALDKMYPDPDDAPGELIHVSTTGYRLPSPVHELVSERNWFRTTVSHCYHQGCYGAFPAVRMAAGSLAAARSGLSRAGGRVDIAHTEICSIHVAPDCLDAEHIICDSLFADGFIRYSAYTNEAFRERSGPGLEVVRYADTTIPNSSDAMTWRPIVNRFEMTLSIDVPRLIAAHAEEFIGTLLRDAGLDLHSDKGDIIWVIHPGGPAIIDLVGSCLRLSKDQISLSKDALREGGNKSSATVPHIWDRILRNPDVTKGTRVVSLAFGPGLTATAMVARVV